MSAVRLGPVTRTISPRAADRPSGGRSPPRPPADAPPIVRSGRRPRRPAAGSTSIAHGRLRRRSRTCRCRPAGRRRRSARREVGQCRSGSRRHRPIGPAPGPIRRRLPASSGHPTPPARTSPPSRPVRPGDLGRRHRVAADDLAEDGRQFLGEAGGHCRPIRVCAARLRGLARAARPARPRETCVCGTRWRHGCSWILHPTYLALTFVLPLLSLPRALTLLILGKVAMVVLKITVVILGNLHCCENCGLVLDVLPSAVPAIAAVHRLHLLAQHPETNRSRRFCPRSASDSSLPASRARNRLSIAAI